MSSLSLKKLLVLLPAFLAAMPVSAAAIEAPGTLLITPGTDIVKADVAGSTELDARQYLPIILQETIVSLAIVGGFLYGQGVSFYGLGKEWDPNQVERWDDGGRDCFLAVTAKVITAMLAAKGTVESAKHLKSKWDMFVHSNWKRSRTLTARETESAFSDLFGTQVSQIGTWNNRRHLAGRDEAENTYHPVFGVNIEGVDIHFTMTEFNETNNSPTFRFGFGDSGASTGSVKRRGDMESLFFRGHGFDYELMHMDLPNLPDVASSDEMEESIYEQLKCSFTDKYSEIGLWENNQMWFQMYDSNGSGTVMAGKLAPFGTDGRSQIKHIGGYMSSLYIDYQCMPSPYDGP